MSRFGCMFQLRRSSNRSKSDCIRAGTSQIHFSVCDYRFLGQERIYKDTVQTTREIIEISQHSKQLYLKL